MNYKTIYVVSTFRKVLLRPGPWGLGHRKTAFYSHGPPPRVK